MKVDRHLLACAAAGLLFACDDTDNKGWLVDRTRVLGARIEAATDPAREAIAPGESMHVAWLVGAPNGTTPLGWSYALCPPVLGNFPEPKCEGELFALGAGTSENELVGMDIAVPANVGTSTELQLLAAFCEGGAAAFDPRRFEATCAGGAAPRLASVTVRLVAKGANANPAIAPDAIAFDGAPLVASERPTGACAASASSPVVTAGSKHHLTVQFRGDERENVPDDGGLERLLASHVVTAGELERQYSMLEPSEAAPKSVSIEWTAPPGGQVGDGGRLTELYVVLRDGRGGAAFARRTICVRR